MNCTAGITFLNLKNKIMARPGIGSLLLAGAAAFGLYKYSKMSQQDKDNLVNKGKQLYDENVPENIKGMFGKKDDTQNASNNTSGSVYSQGV
jgi:hypothetical protein